MTTDPNKGITVSYNHLSLPYKVEITQGVPKELLITYDALGRKLYQEVMVDGNSAERRDYINELQLFNNTVESILHDHGRSVPVPSGDYQYQYHIKDHLGNVRVAFADLNDDGTITPYNGGSPNELLSERHYYPFGMEMVPESNEYVPSPNTTANRYSYNNKELVDDLDLQWLAYGARSYQADIGRFTGFDPNAHKYPSWTPYSYVYNNPVNGIDPDGRDGILLVWKNYRIEHNGRRYPHLGHAGVLLIDSKTGLTKYYEYGRYESDHGNVRNYSVPNVVLDDDGRPTTESLNKVLGFISEKSGKGAVSGAYIESDDFDAMNNYAKDLLNQSDDPDREPYNILNNNCGTFGCDVLDQDPNVSKESPGIVDPRPNSIIDEYRDKFDKVDYNSKDGTTITPTKSLWQSIKDYFKDDDK